MRSIAGHSAIARAAIRSGMNRVAMVIALAACGGNKAPKLDGETVEIGEYNSAISAVTMDDQGAAWFTITGYAMAEPQPAVVCRLAVDDLECAVIPEGAGATIELVTPAAGAKPLVAIEAGDWVTYRRPFTWEQVHRHVAGLSTSFTVWPDGTLVYATFGGLWIAAPGQPPREVPLFAKARSCELFGDRLMCHRPIEEADGVVWLVETARVTPSGVGEPRELARLEHGFFETCLAGDTFGFLEQAGAGGLRLGMIDLGSGMLARDEVAVSKAMWGVDCRHGSVAVVDTEIGQGLVNGRYCDAARCRAIAASFDAPRSNYNRAVLTQRGVFWLATSMEHERDRGGVVLTWVGEPGESGTLSRWNMGGDHLYQDEQLAPYPGGVIASYWGNVVVYELDGRPRKLTLRWTGEPPRRQPR